MEGEGAKTYFLSHSSGDDGIVGELRKALADLGASIAIDSREFHGGDPLEATIRRAIGRSSGVLVLISARAKDSAWVARELKHALKVQAERGGPDGFPVVPLLLDGTNLGAFDGYFDGEPLYAAIRSTALDEAPHHILVALRLREPTDVAPAAQPSAEPVEELVLKLTDPTVIKRPDGSRRASATARLVHEASAANPRAVHGARFRLEAPLGVIEADDLRWYLEDYAVWPTEHDSERVRRIEGQLAQWGRMLHDAALPVAAAAEPLKSWSAAAATQLARPPGVQSARRFSIEVDAAPVDGAPDDAAKAAQESATLLLGLPWELLHDGRGFLFQGASPVRVRRRVPTEHAVAPAVLATPIRVLLASPRPEDDACGYIDHRASARPLVEAIDALVGRVELHLLTPPTLPALRDELDRARRDGRPYHVLHFDGHGVYDRRAGLGALCFEHEEDAARPIGKRRHANVATPELGALLRDHGIPLVFLEACQTAQAESASESVASALLKTGVSSVVAMSHSVLVETSRRFVEAFYRALCAGRRVGSAMLEGQRVLKDSPVRGRVLGVGDFTLQDWFVPVLYQDRDDPQLFHETPAKQAREDWRERLKARLGELPSEPPQGFIGRSRELLALERLLTVERYAVLRGQGGEGKTALAAEFGRWRVRARQVERVAFVSVEQHGDARAVLDAIGRQLVGKGYSVAGHASLEQAVEPVLRELRERTPTLLIVDNLESVLAPPFASVDDATDAITADARASAGAILALCAKLGAAGATTRIIFTSREALPVPFDGATQRIELHRLHSRDAVELVERTLGLDGVGRGREAEAKREEIEALVDAVHGHARTLALLAPALRERGPAATQGEMTALIAEMEQRFPGQREHSLLASVELSLRRLTPEQRERAKVLGVFHGAVDLDMLHAMMGWEHADTLALGEALVATGLASPEPYDHLSLNPALCPYLAATLSEDERAELEARLGEMMLRYVEMLRREVNRNTAMAAALTLMGLPNLVAFLNRVQAAGDAETTISLSTTLQLLLQNLGRPWLLARIAQARDAAARSLADVAWSHARFEAERARCEQLLTAGHVSEALSETQKLHDMMLAAGEEAYGDADYDLATACWMLGRTLQQSGYAGAALPLLEEARRRFEAVEQRAPGCGAARMASVSITDRGDALLGLGRLDEAAQSYEEAIVLAERRVDDRSVAVNKAQIGSVRLRQGRHAKALAAYTEARERFEALGEPGSVATVLHQTGIVYQAAGQAEAAEDAYRRSLALKVQFADLAGQAGTLGQLGVLYATLLGRPEEAVTHFRQAAEAYGAFDDVAGEGRQHNNLANLLHKLGRLDEARSAIDRAIRCKQGLGHTAESWKTLDILYNVETDSGRTAEAAAARAQASAAYLAYRRDGGEPQRGGGRLAIELGRLLAGGDTAAANALLQQGAAKPELLAWPPPLIAALQAVAAGDRNPARADAPGLDYQSAAEIRLLIEMLNAAGH